MSRQQKGEKGRFQARAFTLMGVMRMCRQLRMWDINLVIGRITILILTRPQVWIIICHPPQLLLYKVGMHWSQFLTHSHLILL